MKTKHQQYKVCTDQQLVDLVLKDGNEEAILYLIGNRYDPLLKNLCKKYYRNLFYYEQLQTELYIHLKRDDWHVLRDFTWKSTFGWWLKMVAGHLFLKKMSELIEITTGDGSIGGKEGGKEVPLPDPTPPEEEDIRMVLLIEALQLLKDKDQRFIILKEFEGYKPEEIAKMLENCRRCEGRLKTRINKNTNQLEEIIPTVDYVYTLKARTKAELCVIIDKLKKEFKWS